MGAVITQPESTDMQCVETHRHTDMQRLDGHKYKLI